MPRGAVFADGNQTDLVNKTGAGLLIVADKGLKVETFRTGTSDIQYQIGLDKETKDKIDGGGDGSNSTAVAIYELTEWEAASDPKEEVVLVYDQTEDPQPKPGYFTAIGVYVRKKSVAGVDPASLQFVPAGETKTVSITVNDTDDWTAECIGSGFSAAPLSGTGPGSVDVTATENTTESVRTGKLVVTCRRKNTVVPLSQPDVIPPDYLFAQVINGVLDKWTNQDLKPYGINITPTGTEPANCSPQSFSFADETYTINEVGDQGGGVVLYMYLRA